MRSLNSLSSSGVSSRLMSGRGLGGGGGLGRYSVFQAELGRALEGKRVLGQEQGLGIQAPFNGEFDLFDWSAGSNRECRVFQARGGGVVGQKAGDVEGAGAASCGDIAEVRASSMIVAVEGRWPNCS
jgi:hypothetical protein